MGYSKKEIYDLINNSRTIKANNYYNQLQGIQQSVDALNTLSEVDDPNVLSARKSLKNEKLSAGLGMAGTVLGSVASLADTSLSMAKTNNTDIVQNTINQIGNIGKNNYISNNQIISDYSALNNLQPNISYDDVRGGSDLQRFGNLNAAVLSGAMAGNMVGGPVGAAVGAGIGLLGSGAGWIYGNIDARNKTNILNQNKKDAERLANVNLLSARDNFAGSSFRENYANRAADGGSIQRKSQSITEFAERVSKKKYRRDYVPTIVSAKKDGGLLVRIKR